MGKYTVYQAKALSHDFGTSKQKETPYIALIFETIPKPGEAAAVFPWDGWLSEKAFDRTIDQLKICGATFPDGDLRKVTGYTTKIVSISVEETDFGPRVAWINAPGTVSEENRLGGAKLEALAQRMRGAILAGGQSGAATRPAAPKVRDPFAAVGSSDPGRFDDAASDGRDPSTGSHSEERATEDIPF